MFIYLDRKERFDYRYAASLMNEEGFGEEQMRALVSEVSGLADKAPDGVAGRGGVIVTKSGRVGIDDVIVDFGGLSELNGQI